MAFFKFRKRGEDSKVTPAQPQSIEAIRKRAKQRLIGAVILVLIGVVGFPLLVDNQPRPIAVDIPIDIPDRNKVKPLEPVTPPATSPAQASGPILQTPTPASPPVPQARVDKPAGPAPDAKSDAKSEPKADAKPTPAPAPAIDTGAKAQALLDASPLPKTAVASVAPASAAAAAEERYIVQFGAFADVNKAREARLKVEAAGLKTYSQVADTKEGKRYRVRAGPFATKAEADKAAEQIKKLDLPVAILTL